MSSSREASPVEFLSEVERDLLGRAIESQQAEWVYATFITKDTETLSSLAQARLIGATVSAAKRAVRLSRENLDPVASRKLELLRLSLPLAAPSDPASAEELTRLVASMTGSYGRGAYTPRGETTPLDLQGLSRLLGERRDPELLREVWSGWHAIGGGVRGEFERYVALSNQGARELGFTDTGEMWRSKYEMPPATFADEAERLWQEVRPLYVALHAFVRRRLSEEYGPRVVPPEGPIPAHLLGNMWAQSWEHLLDRLAPPAGEGRSVDLTAALRARGVDPVGMVRYAERFFVSLGFPPLPASFWERSMFTKPPERDVVCHASAWDLDFAEDLRIKMCIEATEEDFQTIHHELGHNYYQWAYAHQPYLFRDGAHDGFHEAVGDTIGLSVTPEYLRKVGLAEEGPGTEEDVRILLASALAKVAFLPFGLLVDRWRWKVFSGEIPPERYNETWWEMRREVQGIAPPAPRGEGEFDPGAKFHVPASVPYMRYFLAHILQFQFHRALAREVGGNAPLHRTSIFGSRAAGDRLRTMLEMGQSRPWPDALEAVTGERRMDAGALLEYYRPLKVWLDEQNRGRPTGW